MACPTASALLVMRSSKTQAYVDCRFPAWNRPGPAGNPNPGVTPVHSVKNVAACRRSKFITNPEAVPMFQTFPGLFLRRSAVALGCMLSLCVTGAVAAADAETYPSRPITIVVPSAAGNVNDAVARLIGQELTKKWGQPIIVDNKPGAGTSIGTRYVARAPADGYTALLTFTAHVQNPWLYTDLGYDPLKDFEPVSEVALSSTILAVSPDFEAKTLPDLV